MNPLSVPFMTKLKQMRMNTIMSLSTSAIQEWKAWTPEGGLEPTDLSTIWSRLIRETLGDDCPLAFLKYNGKFHEYCTAVYKSNHRAPLVDAVPVIVHYAMDTTDRIVDLLRTLEPRTNFSEKWYQETDTHYAILYMNGTWGKNLKYHINWLFNHYESQVQQVRDQTIVGRDGDLCLGKPRNILTQRLKGYSLRALETRMTILQGFKKSLLPLDARDWKDTIEDTAKSLAREPSDMRDELYGELIRTGNELARKSGDVEVRKNFTLSKSACIENSRAAGGFAGHFLAEMGCRDVVYRISPPILVGDIRYHDSSRVGLLYSRCPYQYADLYNELGKFALYERMEEGIADRKSVV